ncbi:MAG: hypothetical protein A3D74_04930 [Candidatus Levybacteria bacterium RIFCSPHIGHO2_02_FULL_37_13]|nr:MAG: hypothetical protein A3D74_04930 [Candidatus Levybacteria bacterium RIFCSPHIGHO2_02_FULL_37_13]OGH40681.1 MAG: hypothetical protein A3B41_02990 [Candidatus Levybacteria bacterium RIFCSPLOWO2_01_FULL_37_26]
METGDLELKGGGFEGELAEHFIDSVFQKTGIRDTKKKTAYCFGPGNGTELRALARRFERVRACESSQRFWEKSLDIVNNNNLNNVALLRDDAIHDLEQESQLGHSYDVVTLLGFGPPFNLDSKKVKRTLLAANNAMRDDSSIIVITSDSTTLEKLYRNVNRVYSNQGEMSVIQVEVDGIKISSIVLSKINPTRIQKNNFSPFSFLEENLSQYKFKKNMLE